MNMPTPMRMQGNTTIKKAFSYSKDTVGAALAISPLKPHYPWFGQMKYKFKIAIKCLPILFSIFLFSCSSSSNNPQNASQQPQQTESTRQIVDKYVNTLTTAQDKAKKAAGAENKRVEEENKAVQEMEGK